VHVVGLNSVRPWRHQSGGVSDDQLERATMKLRQASEGALRIVVLHHQMIGAPWRTRKKPVARRNHVLSALVDSGAELIVGGHIHQGTVAERHEFEVITGDVRGVVVSIAPGLGQPRPQRRGEARGCVVYTAEERTLTADTYIWRDDDWGLTAVRMFPRGREPLAVDPV
jgi:3',5'-cyclic AMP phosphodiesterase CpdA